MEWPKTNEAKRKWTQERFPRTIEPNICSGPREGKGRGGGGITEPGHSRRPKEPKKEKKEQEKNVVV